MNGLGVLALLLAAMVPQSDGTDPSPEIIELQKVVKEAREKGDLGRALSLAEAGFEAQIRSHGEDHAGGVYASHILSEIYSLSERPADAERSALRGLSMARKTVGEGHDIYGILLIDVARSKYERNAYGQAEGYAWKAFAAIERMPAGTEKDSLSFIVIQILAAAEYAQERTDKALIDARRAMVLAERLKVPELMLCDTLTIMAACLHVQGQDQEALSKQRRVLAAHEKVYMPDDPELLSDLILLDAICLAAGRDSEAKAIARRAIRIQEKAVGPDHVELAATLETIVASRMDEQEPLWRDLAECERMASRALAIREKAQGPDHPDLAIALELLGFIVGERSDVIKSEEHFARCLALREKAPKPDDAGIARVLLGLAQVHAWRGDDAKPHGLIRKIASRNSPSPTIADQYARAEGFARRALDAQEKATGPDHPDVIPILDELAEIEDQLGRKSEAAGFRSRADKLRSKPAHATPGVRAASK